MSQEDGSIGRRVNAVTIGPILVTEVEQPDSDRLVSRAGGDSKTTEGGGLVVGRQERRSRVGSRIRVEVVWNKARNGASAAAPCPPKPLSLRHIAASAQSASDSDMCESWKT